MKRGYIQQEIVFAASCSFMQKELCDNNSLHGSKLSTAEKLEEACWNGMLQEWTWGFNKRNRLIDKLFLWKVFIAEQILCAQVSKSPAFFDRYYSIDPYLFMQAGSKNYN